jgi:CBS-domain-containing membrane protein
LPMYVESLMKREVKTCTPEDTLHRAAQTMWESDCGFLPVVDFRQRLVGVITDRDICMAAFTQGVALASTNVASAMSRNALSCPPRANLTDVAALMASRQLRRLPVIDRFGKLVGVVTLSDLVRHAQATNTLRRTFAGAKLARVLAKVCAPRAAPAVAAE